MTYLNYSLSSRPCKATVLRRFRTKKRYLKTCRSSARGRRSFSRSGWTALKKKTDGKRGVR
ncbi:hypothetical protein DPMN_127081 [Dreissena polymorpha]|uniref:Uncharacterized protein n=1 Tax=Dreissena polymorpha TaxID=45954 RepID=A0A9D4GYJ8_DREPO|nr:hypothetical protein DPMN_127081 [Dreissena polymorpha]